MSSSFDVRWIVFGLVALAAGVGAWLVYRGLRGRRVGDHPTCARCGFDLRGAPEGSTRCPECGAETTARNATRVGTRHRRPWLAAVGALCLLLAVAGAGLSVARIDWRSHLPNWYVLYEARSGSAASRVVPIEQLLGRDAIQPLNADERVALARALIAVQRDPSNLWKPKWGDWVAQRLIGGALPKGDADAFVANLLADCRVTVRSIVAEGSPLPVGITFNYERSGLSQESIVAAFNFGNRRLSVNGAEVTDSRPQNFSNAMPFTHGTTFYVFEEAPAVRTLPLGSHRIEWTYALAVGAHGADSLRPDAGAPVLGRAELKWAGTVEVVPPGQALRLVPDPSKAAAIRAAIIRPTVSLPTPSSGTGLNVEFGKMPVNVALDIFAKQGDGPEQRVGSIRSAAGFARGRVGFGYLRDAGRRDTPLKPGTCTLIFRPSLEEGETSADLLEIWDGEVRIDGVPVYDNWR